MNESRSSLVTSDDDHGESISDDVSSLDIAHLDAKNMAAIIEKINDLKKLTDLLIKRLRDHDLKVGKLIKFLKVKKEAVDKSYRKQNSAASIFSGISVTGGVVIIVGGAGAGVTAGASFPLVIAGGITLGIGAFGSIGTQIFSKCCRWLIIQKCNKECRKIKSDTEEIGATYEELHSKCMAVCEILRLSAESPQDPNQLNIESSELTGKNLKGIAGKTAAVSLRLVRLSNLLAKVIDTFHLEFVGRVMIPILEIAKAIFIIGTAITGIGIGIDLLVGGKALYDLVKGNQCAESIKLDLAINEAENHAKLISSYLQSLKHHPEDLLHKAIELPTTIRKLAYQNEELQNANKIQPETEQLS